MFPALAVILYILYIAVAIIGPKVSGQLASELDPIFPSTYRLIGAGVLFVIFAIVIIWVVFLKPPAAPQPQRRPAPQGPGFKPTPPKTGAQAPGKFKPVSKPAHETKTASKPQVKVNEKKEIEPKVIIYPVEVEGGIIGDTYIKLSPEKVLKLRSMVVEPEYIS